MCEKEKEKEKREKEKKKPSHKLMPISLFYPERQSKLLDRREKVPFHVYYYPFHSLPSSIPETVRRLVGRWMSVKVTYVFQIRFPPEIASKQQAAKRANFVSLDKKKSF